VPPPSATAVAAQYEADVKSIGALRGSAKGRRNITKRLEAIGTLGILAGERCLDVGCATGDYTEEIAHNFERVDAIDVERNRLDVFRQERRLRNVVVAEMSVYSMDFEDGTFDAVTLIEVLEHLERPADALAQVSRVLRPGGQLFITTPNRLWPFEQHGLKVRGKKRPGYMFPGLVWLSKRWARMPGSEVSPSPGSCRRWTSKEALLCVESSIGRNGPRRESSARPSLLGWSNRSANRRRSARLRNSLRS
jgi:SAM-dependent methyltransferase